MRERVAQQQSIVFVVDDEHDVRESLKGLLQSVGLSAECFASTAEFLQARHPDGPSCLILDVRLQRDNGLHFFAELRKTRAKTSVIIVTAHGDIPMAVQAIRNGAVDFLSKPFRDQDLLDAVREALDGDRARRDAEKGLDDLPYRYDCLSPREKFVMSWVCAGFMNKQIGAELNINEITVKVHRRNVMMKMQAKSLPELVRMADRLIVPAPTDWVRIDK